VWVQSDGRLQLLDNSLMEAGKESKAPAQGTDQQRSLALLGKVATLALEGSVRPADEPPAPLRAAVPLHARPLLDRLVGVGEPYTEVRQVQADLAAIRDRLPEVTRGLRAGQLATLATFLCLGLLVMFLQGDWRWALVVPVAWVIWAFCFHGGLSLRFMGLAL